MTQPLDRTGNRLPVGQRAPEPARIDEILSRALRSLRYAILRLALGTNEQNASALGNRVADSLQCTMQHRHRLCEVDDVNVVASTEDVIRHLRIPSVGLVTKVNASLKQLTHRKIGKRHFSILRLVPPETCEHNEPCGPDATGRLFEP